MKKTMRDLYDDGSNHQACNKYEMCIDCGDCNCKKSIIEEIVEKICNENKKIKIKSFKNKQETHPFLKILNQTKIMPIFSYQCKNCEFVVEDKLVFTDLKTIKCPNCGSTAHKLPSFANFIIHGYKEKNGYSKKENIDGK